MGDQGTSDPDAPHHLVDHLFRNRAGQMVAWLARVFGPAHLDLAEEVVQDALVKALQQWPYSGIPDNPSGWLLAVARNGALDVLRRNASFAGRAHEIARELERATKRQRRRLHGRGRRAAHDLHVLPSVPDAGRADRSEPQDRRRIQRRRDRARRS